MLSTNEIYTFRNPESECTTNVRSIFKSFSFVELEQRTQNENINYLLFMYYKFVYRPQIALMKIMHSYSLRFLVTRI